MVIPAIDFPISCQQLADLWNSQLMNWLFRNVFNTHKILRGDLESLPIHTGYFDLYQEFNEPAYLDYLGIVKDKDESYRLKAFRINHFKQIERSANAIGEFVGVFGESYYYNHRMNARTNVKRCAAQFLT